MSDMSQMGNNREEEVVESAEKGRSFRRGDVDDQLERLKANLSVESARIAQDSAWFDALMLADDVL